MKHFGQKYISLSRPFIAGLFCLTILFARQTVFLLHKCDHMNSGLIDFIAVKNSTMPLAKKGQSGEPIKERHCHSENSSPSEKHNHNSCAICFVYEQLLQGMPPMLLAVHSAPACAVSDALPIHHSAPVHEGKFNVALARGPPPSPIL